MRYVLGAPGSGKTTLVPLLKALLPAVAVVDWDALMPAASALAGVDIRSAPETWDRYAALVHAVVRSIRPAPLVLLGVMTPAEVVDLPAGDWVLLDCSDEERRRRLVGRGTPSDVAQAIEDADRYRRLGLPTIDTTDRRPTDVAERLAAVIGAERRSPE